MLPRPRVHFIERAKHVRKLLRSSEYESGYWWRIGRSTAQSLIGGHLYLHSAQAEPSRDGGVIVSYRIQEFGRHVGRYVFRFRRTKRHVGVVATSGCWWRYKQVVLASAAVLALSFPLRASAESSTTDQLKKAEKYLRSQCNFAVALVRYGDVPVHSLCVFDGTVNAGTRRERSGCTVSMLDANSGDHKTVISPSLDPLTDERPCSKKSVEEVLRGELKSPYEGVSINPLALGGADVKSVWDYFTRKFGQEFEFVVVVNKFNAKVPPGATTIKSFRKAATK